MMMVMVMVMVMMMMVTLILIIFTSVSTTMTFSFPHNTARFSTNLAGSAVTNTISSTSTITSAGGRLTCT